jgi:hypothetical protein
LIVSFAMQKLFSWTQPHFVIFAFADCIFGAMSMKSNLSEADVVVQSCNYSYLGGQVSVTDQSGKS